MQTRNKAQATFTPGTGGGQIGAPTGASSSLDASRRAKPSGAGGPSIGNAADDRYLNTRKRFLITTM